MKAWLVNDKLTCIPGTHTFWHDLLDWFPFIEDKTGVEFYALPNHIESEASRCGSPDLIIRNATYFRSLNIPVKTISLLQDISNSNEQLNVLDNSTSIVVNSEYTRSQYPNLDPNRTFLIPLGIDFNLFKKLEDKESLRQKWGIVGDAICFIGSRNNIKGWNDLQEIILRAQASPNLQFVLILKDEQPVSITASNYKSFHRIPHHDLVEIVNACDVGICTSIQETQHLSGIEMGACGLPMVTTNVGVYYNREPGDWGCRYKDPIAAIEWALENNLDSRTYWLNEGMSLDSCRQSWRLLINNLLNG